MSAYLGIWVKFFSTSGWRNYVYSSVHVCRMKMVSFKARGCKTCWWERGIKIPCLIQGIYPVCWVYLDFVVIIRIHSHSHRGKKLFISGQFELKLFVCRPVNEWKYPFFCANLALHETKLGQRRFWFHRKSHIIMKHWQESDVIG